jgi:hypothetical protein
VAGSIAGVRPYALTRFVAAGHDRGGLPSPTRLQGYYHALGVSAVPFTELCLPGDLHVLARARFDGFHSIDGLDSSIDTAGPALALTDRRATIEASLVWEPRPLRFVIGGERSLRLGEIGPINASRAEVGLSTAVGVLF